MTNELNTLNELRIGDIVGTTNRTVIAYTKLSERHSGESFARWVAICTKDTEQHRYVVWDVIARPQGWHCANGEYCTTLSQALQYYKKRGGDA